MSDPFKTGNTAFRLGLGKALVPFVFVFAPSLLIMVRNFSMQEFVLAFAGCIMGITVLSAALSNYMFTRMRAWERIVCVVAAVLMIAPELVSTLIGVAIMVPVVISQLAGSRRRLAS